MFFRSSVSYRYLVSRVWLRGWYTVAAGALEATVAVTAPRDDQMMSRQEWKEIQEALEEGGEQQSAASLQEEAEPLHWLVHPLGPAPHDWSVLLRQDAHAVAEEGHDHPNKEHQQHND